MRWCRVLALGLLLSACGGAVAPDTNCEDPDPVADQVRFASIVVLGTVTEWDGTTAKLAVEEIWRGPDMPEEVEIVPEPGRTYAAGVKYLVFPTDYPSPLVDEPCSATSRWDEAFAEYKPDRARTPSAAPAQDANLPWEWVIGAILVAGGYGVARRIIEKRRHPEPVWNPDHRLADE